MISTTATGYSPPKNKSSTTGKGQRQPSQQKSKFTRPNSGVSSRTNLVDHLNAQNETTRTGRSGTSNTGSKSGHHHHNVSVSNKVLASLSLAKQHQSAETKSVQRAKDNSTSNNNNNNNNNVNLSEKFTEFLQQESQTLTTNKNQLNAANFNMRHLTGKKNVKSLFGGDQLQRSVQSSTALSQVSVNQSQEHIMNDSSICSLIEKPVRSNAQLNQRPSSSCYIKYNVRKSEITNDANKKKASMHQRRQNF